MAKRCVGCMKMKNNSPVCEHCGYNENIPNYPHQLPIGTVLRGQYMVGKVLGQGGFGITYIGWDNTLDAAVAIKEFYPGSFVNRDCSHTLFVTCNGESAENLFRHNRDRFVQEAKILAKLSHVPGIVRVHNLFTENNTAYIIMEYVEGIDLKRYLRMRGQTLSVEEMLHVMKPIMEALIQVHKAELVHRDISPDNIMVQNDGSIKLLDFGAAREVINAEVDKELPQSTEAIIKHGFAPIEQYRRKGSLGPWTDVYSLCATIYYCLAGKVPADAPERMIGDDNVNWAQIPGLTEQQRAVLEKGMAMRPEERIASVQELYQVLYTSAKNINLKTYIETRDQPLCVGEMVTLMSPVMVALIQMHDHNLIHRNVYPENIIIQSDGTAKLLGSGVTREVAETEQSIPMKGFAPLELYRRKGNLGPWTDMYSLCATIYYCLTGKVPADAPDRMIGDDNVNWAQIPGLSEQQRAVLEKGMAMRIGSVQELYQVLYSSTTNYNLMKYIQIRKLQSCSEMLFLMNPVMKALIQMHSKNLIHLNIHPENIIIQPDGTAKLLGFGVPLEFAEAERYREIADKNLNLTRNGFTPIELYQNKGRLGPWTDIYSLCATIYYCFTGKIPQDASERITGDDNVDWTQIPGLSYPDRSALKRGMAILPESRTSSVQHLHADLLICVDPPPPPPPPKPSFSEKIRRMLHNVLTTASRRYRSLLPNLNPRAKAIGTIALAAVLVLGAGTLLAKPEDGWVEKKGKTYYYVDGEYLTGWQTIDGKYLFFEEDGAWVEDIWKKNILIEDPLDNIPGINREFITSVTFLDNTKDAPSDSIKISTDGVVLAWTKENGSYYDVYVAADGGINAKYCCERFFEDCEKLQQINFNDSFHTDEAYSMYRMFVDCSSLISLDLTSFNTSNVTDMRAMFISCDSLTNLDLSNFDTSNVTDMGFIFQYCTSLTSLDVSNFNTSNVTYMGYMFNDCRSLINLDLSSFDTSNVTDMHSMFNLCRSLANLDLSNFDTSNVTDMGYMFHGCNSLTNLNLSSFDTSNVTDMGAMFDGCNKLKTLDVSTFDTSNVTDMSFMFYSCDSLINLDLSNFDTSNVTDMSNMFDECTHINNLDLHNWDVSKVSFYFYFMDRGDTINGRPWEEFFK